MNIQLSNTKINSGSVQTVNARDLHEFLESKQEFANWIKNRIGQYGFVEGQDFTIDKFINGRATLKDYHITLDMAKELSMVERNEKGKQARQYFIECERRTKDPVRAFLSAAKSELLSMASEVAKEVEILKPKAEAMERLEASGGSIVPRAAAKLVSYPERKFFKLLQFKNFGYRCYSKLSCWRR